MPSRDEYFQRESQQAREALARVKGELVDSLVRTADPIAWTERYPWASLGTAAAAGVATGWTVGHAFRKSAPATEAAAAEPVMEAGFEKPSATSRLVGGLGALAGSLAAAAATAAAESLGNFVKDAIHDSLHPQASSEPTASTEEDSSPQSRGDAERTEKP